MRINKKRLFEIMPGFVSWNLILFLVWGGYFLPVVTAYFILAFDVYWVWNGFTHTVATILSYYRIKAAEHTDWMTEVRGFGDWQQVRHIVLILVGNEPKETFEKTVENLALQSFPLEQIAIVMATEARFPNGKMWAEEIGKTVGTKFGGYLITAHPGDIPGEIKGKSSNESWAAKEAKKYFIDKNGWSMDFTTITSNDSDSRLHREYFSYLTFKFLDDPQRYLKFWQPAIVFYNNIWRIPAATRVVNTLSSVWQIGLLMRKDRLVNFSNYSASLKMIDEIGYWDADVIPEDYRIFFKAFFKLKGLVEVEPIFLPSSADAAESTSTWKTFVNDYQQKKRWAWGVSDIPLFMDMYFADLKISFWNKTFRLLRVTRDHLLWPVNWFVITAGVTISTLVNPNFQRTSIGFMLPRISSGILTLTLLFLVVLLIIDAKQRPPRPAEVPWWKPWLAPFEFLLMPVVGFFFVTLPGLDAHTRLMLGKYLEYRITEKVNK